MAITVEDLTKRGEYTLDLTLVAGHEGMSRKLTTARIQKPGLALAGYTDNLYPNRMQILGNIEISYLNTLEEDKARKALEELCSFEIPCIVVTRGLNVPPSLKEIADGRKIPVFTTSLPSAEFIARVLRFLEDQLAERTSVHGVLMDVIGVGILFLGKSGIGKSECALDLILRGYRLVADDVVEIQKQPPSSLLGSGSDIIRYHMEIRGLGIINIKDLFGVAAVRDQKKIELVVELVEWNTDEEYDRLGEKEETYEILGVEVPLVRIPVRPGRNIATIIEVAARNHLLKLMGYHSALEFQRRLSEKITTNTEEPKMPGVKVE